VKNYLQIAEARTEAGLLEAIASTQQTTTR
jgi:hypothetical protein